MDWDTFWHPLVKIHVLPGGRMPELGSRGANAYDVFARAVVDDEKMDPQHPNLRLPLLPLWQAAGMNRNTDYPLPPGESALVGVGFVLEMPREVGCLVIARSGHSSKVRNRQIHIGNSPSLGDSDFRGELVVRLVNESSRIFQIRHGMKIAQIIFLPTLLPRFEPVGSLSDLSATLRGGAGLGSTGDF